MMTMTTADDNGGGGGGGGGFFLAGEDFGRMLDHSFPACASFVCLFRSGG